MALNIFEIVAKIGLDVSEYNQEIEGASQKSSGFSAVLKQVGLVSDTLKDKIALLALHHADAQRVVDRLAAAFNKSAKESGADADKADTLKNKIAVLALQHADAQKEVDRLAAAFNKSAKESGAGAEQTRKLAQQLKEAEAKGKGFKEQIDQLSGGLEGTGEKAKAFADKLKSGLSSIGKATGKAALTGVTAAAKAVGFLTSQSLAAYGNYEQLAGGVQTLFGKSADTIMDYANSAYKTAGLSAHTYMETVSAFSASLLQGLGGNTQQAAQYADRAVTDMADNANQMGTSMEVIQNAYQGFAEQNFTIKRMSAA